MPAPTVTTAAPTRNAFIEWIVPIAAVSLVFVNYPNLFSTAFPGAHYLNQPLIDALHGADISGVASVLIAAGSYLGLRKVMA